MHTNWIVVLMTVGVLLAVVACLLVRGAAIQEREAAAEDEAFAKVRRAIDPLAGLR
jgi:hypothetical protein